MPDINIFSHLAKILSSFTPINTEDLEDLWRTKFLFWLHFISAAWSELPLWKLSFTFIMDSFHWVLIFVKLFIFVRKCILQYDLIEMTAMLGYLFKNTFVSAHVCSPNDRTWIWVIIINITPWSPIRTIKWKGLCENKGYFWCQNKDYVGGATRWSSNSLYKLIKDR